MTGPPHDLQIREVRSDSLVLLWKPPVYQGRDPVNGFYVDIKEAEAPEEAWRGVNTKATEKTFLKVSHRETDRNGLLMGLFLSLLFLSAD